MYPACPEVTCPTLILHGTRDDLIPVETSREYAAQRPLVHLVEVEDDHELRRSLFQLEREIRSFFRLEGAHSSPFPGADPSLSPGPGRRSGPSDIPSGPDRSR